MAKREKGKLAQWLDRNGLSREAITGHSWLRPFASRISHSELWRFTRRSVPRGVALGLLVGIFLLIPGVQIIGVALLALPVRANIPIGAAMTFLSMPATTPFILAASLYVGETLFRFGADMATFQKLVDTSAPLSAWVSWLASEAAPAIMAGLAIISVVSAAIGYVIAAFLWRWWIGRKWHRRHRKLAP
jgi:uncharacterized protein